MKPTAKVISALVAGLLCTPSLEIAATPSLAVSAVSDGQSNGIEIDQTLYVQAPDFPGAGDSIVVVWLPAPLVSTCMGRTMKECFKIDYCIRTTNPDGPQCRDLGIPRARLPHYPAEMRPRRAISVVLRAMSDDHGFDRLKASYRNAPPSSLKRLSPDATIKARISYIDDPAFQRFNVLEVLSAP